VTGAAACEPDVGGFGVAIDDQVTVRTVFVLADFGGNERRLRQLGKAFRDDGACSRDPRGGWRPIGAGRIDRFAAGVVGDLDSAAVRIGDAVEDPFAEIDPDREVGRKIALRSGWSAEVVDLLPRRTDPVADHLRKEFAQPRPAGENEGVGFDARAVIELNLFHRSADDRAWFDASLPIGSAGFLKRAVDDAASQ